MTHLYIEQATDRTEEVNSSIISKLYELAISGDLDNTSDLKGRLHVASCYKSQYDYLNNNFDNLYIQADNYYIDFADSSVENILLNNNIGDGVGISLSDAASINNGFNGIFNSNTSITSFDELKYFTGITKINHNGPYYNYQAGEFYGCTNLVSIDLTNIDIIEGGFNDCSSLKYVKNFNGTTIIRAKNVSRAFSNIPIEYINLSNCEIIGMECFRQSNHLINIGNLNKVVFLGAECFAGCSALQIDINVPNLGNYEQAKESGYITINNGTPKTSLYRTFARSGIKSIQNLGSIVERIEDGEFYMSPMGWRYGFASYCTNLDYVILPEQLNYIGKYAFKGDTNLRYIKINAITPPTLGQTDNTNEEYPFYDTTCKFYVPDASVNDYKSASGWSSMSSRIFSINQFATDFPDDYAAEQATLQNS